MDRIYNKVTLTAIFLLSNILKIGYGLGRLFCLFLVFKKYFIYFRSVFTSILILFFGNLLKAPPPTSSANNNSYNNRLKNKYQGCSVFCSIASSGQLFGFSLSVMSDSLRPHEPTRLLYPWDFPDKNTGVGCHFLLWAVVGEKSWKKRSLCLVPLRLRPVIVVIGKALSYNLKVQTG